MESDQKEKDTTSQTNDPLSSLPGSLAITFHTGGNEEVCRAMEKWIRALLEEAEGKLSLTRTDSGDQSFLPSISLKAGDGSSTIHYHFVPQGTEEAPFLELLWQLAQARNSPEAEPQGEHSGRDSGELLLFVSNQCPNCPRTVRTVHSMCMERPSLSLHIFEAMQDPELAGQHDIKSVPTLIVEQGLRFVGEVEHGHLSAILRARNTPAFLNEKIRHHIRQGQAEQAARLLAEEADPSFLAEDLGKAAFQERIGILLALEEALEIDPGCLDPMVKGLLPCLEAEEASIRGDIADLLGKIGHPDALPGLQKLTKDSNPDVVEAAEEALENINQAGR